MVDGKIDINLFLELDEFIQKEILYLLLNEFYQDDLILINDKHIDLILNLIYSKKSNGFICLPNNVYANKCYNELYFSKKLFLSNIIDNVEEVYGNGNTVFQDIKKSIRDKKDKFRDVDNYGKESKYYKEVHKEYKLYNVDLTFEKFVINSAPPYDFLTMPCVSSKLRSRLMLDSLVNSLLLRSLTVANLSCSRIFKISFSRSFLYILPPLICVILKKLP